MDSDRPRSAKELFLAAHKLDPEARGAFLDEACQGCAELRQEVESLPEHDSESTDHFAAPAVRKKRLVESDERIGPYRWLAQIGEGGMGIVYLAEQTEPVRRRVALKLIKLVMDTKQVIARFEAEHQALAVMDHTCVAKVFDAGVGVDGRSYFVMEYVPGAPITEHCDRQWKHRLESL